MVMVSIGRPTSLLAYELAEDGQRNEPTVANKTKSLAPRLRGKGEGLEILLYGSVFDDGQPADGAVIGVSVKTKYGREQTKTIVKNNQFEAWIPIGKYDWFFVEVIAKSRDGQRRASIGIENAALRQFAIEGVRLNLVNANRRVSIKIRNNGKLIPGAHVVAAVTGGVPLRTKSDENGEATFAMLADERINQLTAWTHDHLIGGYAFYRTPRRDPLGMDFDIELEDCRDQTVRFITGERRLPVAGLPFNLIVGTGPPNYNFPATAQTFPHSRMTTDDRGEAVFHWFPDWLQHVADVQVIDPNWVEADESLKTAADGTLVMNIKQRVARQRLVGRLTSVSHDVRGLMVQLKTFQGEAKNRSDSLFAFADEAGNFAANCIPGSTYYAFVNDSRVVSNTVDLIPYEPDTGRSNRVDLQVSAGRPVKIRVTTGATRRPMANAWVRVRDVYHVSWYDKGERQRGSGGRTWRVKTDRHGIAVATAVAGANLRLAVDAGEWRSEERNVKVEEGSTPVIRFHRDVDEDRTVTGRIVAPPRMNVNLGGAELFFGSIDGETDEREQVSTDELGRFEFNTRAIRLGMIAFTSDGKAAGILKPTSLDEALEINLRPTCSFQGRLFGMENKPLANHAVRVHVTVRGDEDSSKSFFNGFTTKTFRATTDAEGNYALSGLPAGIKMRLRADPLDDSNQEVSLDSVVLYPAEERPPLISYLQTVQSSNERAFPERYESVLRDADLNGFYVLVMIFDETSSDFVGRYLLDAERTPNAMSFMNLKVLGSDVVAPRTRRFVKSRDWPEPRRGDIFLCALDGDGKELGRTTIHTRDDAAKTQAATFLNRYAPVQSDAQAQWDAAFVEASHTNRKVWARISQRYCAPCFRLSRWIDDHKELLERDYVLLKIDDVRDKKGRAIAKLVVGDRNVFGVPFHAIFNAKGKRLIDSTSPVGNIGYPANFEGQKHLRKMLSTTTMRIAPSEIDELIASLK